MILIAGMFTHGTNVSKGKRALDGVLSVKTPVNVAFILWKRPPIDQRPKIKFFNCSTSSASSQSLPSPQAHPLLALSLKLTRNDEIRCQISANNQKNF